MPISGTQPFEADLIDTLWRVETPEGVPLELRPAGLIPRSLALIIDQCLQGFFLMLFASVLLPLGPAGMGVWVILLFVVHWLYPVLCEVLWTGQTLGKRAMNLRVLMADGLPVGWRASLLRNLLRVVDGLPFAYTLGFFSVLITKRFQRLGDLLAGTLVVHVSQPSAASSIPLVRSVRPKDRLDREEQGGILTFAERSTSLSPARQVELADILSPLTRATGETGVQTVQGMANYFLRGD